MTELTNEQIEDLCLQLSEEELATLDDETISFTDIAKWEALLPAGVPLNYAMRKIVDYRNAEIARFQASPWLLYIADWALSPGGDATP